MPTPLRARVLSVGDELVLGRTVDTNATFICRLLSDAGFQVGGVEIVGDAQGAIVAGIRRAAQDADLVIISGGLGPTDDDRTRHALAESLGVPLQASAVAWKQVLAHYHRLGRTVVIPESNRRQALVPKGCAILKNPVGTAPGLLGRLGSCRIAVVPGVPHEMKQLVRDVVQRHAVRWFARRLQPPCIGEVWCSGLGESTAQERIGKLLTETAPQVGITVSELGHLTLRIVGTAAQVRTRSRELRACLTEFLLPQAGLAPSLVALLHKRRATITAAESCTGGHVSALLAAVPGASAVFRESLVTYHADAKQRYLHVPSAVLRAGVVSEACIRAMASGALVNADATVAIATTGIAGPGGGTVTDPVGTVWIAAATAKQVLTKRLSLVGDRERIQRRAAAAALLLAWQALQP